MHVRKYIKHTSRERILRRWEQLTWLKEEAAIGSAEKCEKICSIGWPSSVQTMLLASSSEKAGTRFWRLSSASM
jgi:hypothetical protein